jgi:hypothetical protein
VFTFLASTWALTVAFVVFLAFGNYEKIKSSASAEADAVKGLYLTAEGFSSATTAALQHDLICYARSVVKDDWPAMSRNTSSPVTDAAVQRLQGYVDRIATVGNNQAASYRQFLTELADRSAARSDRLEEAIPIVPAIVWIALGIASSTVLAYTYGFASRKDGFVRMTIAATVTGMVISILLALIFLDTAGKGEIGPSAMSGAIAQTQRVAPNPQAVTPCLGPT